MISEASAKEVYLDLVANNDIKKAIKSGSVGTIGFELMVYNEDLVNFMREVKSSKIEYKHLDTKKDYKIIAIYHPGNK